MNTENQIQHNAHIVHLLIGAKVPGRMLKGYLETLQLTYSGCLENLLM